MKNKSLKETISGKIPYLIAEIGVNHEGDFNLAKHLIDLAKEGGANAAKFQTYKAHKLASKESPSYWDTSKETTKSQYELFQKYDKFSKDDYYNLSEYCQKVGIDFLSTPFDDDAVDFLNPIIPFFKVASADINNIPLLRKIATKNKPIILSTGASTLSEVENAIQVINEINQIEIGLLHCILNYPTNDELANLNMIESLKKIYPECVIGYSDHTIPDPNMLTLTTAYILGAEIIEKHFTHNKKLEGNDHYHAMDVKDTKIFRNITEKIIKLKGKKSFKKPIQSENISRLNARRSIVTKGKIKFGKVIKESDITYKRPGTGISVEHWDFVVGKVAKRSLDEDHIIKWDEIE